MRDSSSLSVTTQLTALAHQQLEGREGGAAVSPEGKRGEAAVSLEELLSLAVLMQSMVGEECSDQGSEEKELKVHSEAMPSRLPFSSSDLRRPLLTSPSHTDLAMRSF